MLQSQLWLEFYYRGIFKLLLTTQRTFVPSPLNRGSYYNTDILVSLTCLFLLLDFYKPMSDMGKNAVKTRRTGF